MLKNSKNIPLPFAVFLATDTYDMIPAVNKISVTTLLRSTRRIILGQRMGTSESEMDIADTVSASLGTAIHAALEAAWQEPQVALRALGYPERIVSNLVVNPTKPLEEGQIAAYTELRTEKEFKGFIISGSADFILDNMIYDYKTVGMFKYLKADYADYVKQISIYRWLNQDKITSEEGRIELYIRDWDSLKASYDSNYPQTPFVEVRVPLLPLYQVESFLTRKLDSLVQYKDTPESDLPQCTQEELWQSDPVWQYVSKGGAKKNFPNPAQANAYRNQKGSGSVELKPAKAKACTYCTARPLCSQAQALSRAGLLD